MANVKMIAPVGMTGAVQGGGQSVQIANDRTVTVDGSSVPSLLAAGFRMYTVTSARQTISSPAPADKASVVASADIANGDMTLAAQPAQARKLQVEVSVAEKDKSSVTAGSLFIAGDDQDGASVSETIPLMQTETAVVKSKLAYSRVRTIRVSGYAAADKGNKISVGVAEDLAIHTAQNSSGFDVKKISRDGEEQSLDGMSFDPVARTVAIKDMSSSADYDLFATYGMAT
jgi:hypothetical protein